MKETILKGRLIVVDDQQINLEAVRVRVDDLDVAESFEFCPDGYLAYEVVQHILT